MGRTQYTKIKELLRDYKKDKGNIISFNELILLIRINIGNNKYTVIKPCLSLMKDSGLIKSIDNETAEILDIPNGI